MLNKLYLMLQQAASDKENAEEYYVFDIAALPVLANTGTCMQSFKYLFDNQNSLFKAIIGSTLFQH